VVDTINPNTGQPDLPASGQQPLPAGTPEDRFYGGFDKPAETNINLADLSQVPDPNTPQAVPQPQMTSTLRPVEQPPINDMRAAAPAMSPAGVQHTSYTNAATAVNWRGVMVIAAVTGLAGAGLYFGLSSNYSKQITVKQTEKDSLEAEFITLSETPTPLELPVTETPVVDVPVEDPVVDPVVDPPIETPVETPDPVIPAATGDDRSGSLG